MTVVCNSTPLIYLAAIARFDLLRDLFNRILIPSAVYNEVVTQGTGRWGAAETSGANWIDRRPVSDPVKVRSLLARLRGGESEVIILAEELGADLVIMDDSTARRELAQRGLRFMGTVGVLMTAKHRGLLPILKPDLDQLRASGFRLSDSVYQACLAAVGE
jgi:predicted nucleic acid-binding protein